MRGAWQGRAFQAGVLQVSTQSLARADHSRFESMFVTMALFACIHAFHIDLMLASLAGEGVSIHHVLLLACRPRQIPRTKLATVRISNVCTIPGRMSCASSIE